MRNASILLWVINMKYSKDILASTLKTAQMGQVGIRSVINYNLKPELIAELKHQMQEYNAIERTAQAMAYARGWNLENLSAGLKIMAGTMAKIQLTGSNQSSKVAAMTITGNTRGMVKSLKNLHRYSCTDHGVTALAEKLLDTERENILSMQGFV